MGAANGVDVAAAVPLLFLVAALEIGGEYQRGVLFRLGRVIRTRNPGPQVIIPLIDGRRSRC